MVKPAADERISGISEILEGIFTDAKPLLAFSSCYELLVAVILSAQCTDDQVNLVTPALFEKWPTPAALAAAPIAEIETTIRSTGFFRIKARSISGSARMLVDRFGSRVPDTIDQLVTLPGVGRKTANLVVSACFGKPGIIVDTHVSRVCARLGFSVDRDPGDIERILAAALPPDRWTAASHALNRLGKRVCTARKPDCPGCPVGPRCPSLGRTGETDRAWLKPPRQTRKASGPEA